MIKFLKHRWFLICLVVLIPLGLGIGLLCSVTSLKQFESQIVGSASRYLVAFVLFLMSITLDIRKLTAAIKAPAPVLWACAVNFIAIPLIAIPLSKLQMTPDFAVGIIIAACVPSTMASASVWTRKAFGNDAVSLLGTILTNGFCFLITPFWLSLSLGDAITLDTLEMVERLVYTALIPITLGQVCRSIHQLKQIADDRKTLFGTIAQICILSLVFWASVKGGGQLQSSDSTGMTLIPILLIWGSCLLLHLVGLALAFYGGIMMRFQREDIVAVVFSGSQKTLPIGIYIATDLLAGRNLPFAAFPILMFHVTQLVLDTLLIAPLTKWSQAESAAIQNQKE
ncbi:bile acid:sodium symporter [Planctomicrobium sp.]|jgi:solute carrier family 10 (sodium/bile acid cotransporter), member 7|nr:bile acid:sodium symporter [Planctomicrobium sp.]MBT5019456.1 hypothetical protein [Planctomicrobium sp.]MDB4733479.1 bile acid:sodium symporter [Planctomicrobium sp.]